MNRRGFLGSIAALVGAKLVKGKLPDDTPTQPIHTAGYLQTVPFDNGTATITTYTGNSNTHWIHLDWNEQRLGEGVRWSYTSNGGGSFLPNS